MYFYSDFSYFNWASFDAINGLQHANKHINESVLNCKLGILSFLAKIIVTFKKCISKYMYVSKKNKIFLHNLYLGLYSYNQTVIAGMRLTRREIS